MRFVFVSVMFLLGAVIGCSQTDLPPRAMVEGIVTLDGKPLTTGWVQFVPDASQGNRGPAATGAIDADGRYRLSTDRQASSPDGAVLGPHRISVEARAPRTSELDTLPRLLVPEKYVSPETSGLSAEVRQVPLNEVNLSLTSK